MTTPHYHPLPKIMSTLKQLGINKTPKPEVVSVEGEREKLLGRLQEPTKGKL